MVGVVSSSETKSRDIGTRRQSAESAAHVAKRRLTIALHEAKSTPVKFVMICRRLLLSSALLLILGCKGRAPVGSIGSDSPAPTITLDGSINKWLAKTPVWDNGPVPAGNPPDHVHI